MRTNYNDSSSRGGKFPRRQGGGGSNSSGRRPQGKRGAGQHSNGAINVSNVSAARNKYLDMAKDALSNGNRVEAENYFQHAEHYSKLLNAATASKKERDDATESHNQHRRSNTGRNDRSNVQEEKAAEVPVAENVVESEPSAQPTQVIKEAAPSSEAKPEKKIRPARKVKKEEAAPVEQTNTPQPQV